MTKPSKPPLSSSAFLALLYGILGIVSVFLHGSQWFMLVGALVADLFALLVTNIVFHIHPERRGEHGLKLANSIAMLFGVFFIALVFVMMTSVVISNTESQSGMGSKDDLRVIRENAIPAIVVFGVAGVAYWIRFKFQAGAQRIEQLTYFEVRQRLFMMLGFTVIVVIAIAVSMLSEGGSWVLFALFIIRAAMEFLGRRFWKRFL